MRNLEEARVYNKQEKSTETSELWSAILATHEALLALGGTGLPELHVNRAKANLIRAGEATSGDFTDDDLKQIAASDGTRVWSATMGTVFKDEPIVHDGELYICLQQHRAQAGWAPGTIGGRTLFRLLRSEPEEPGVYLDFEWGEHVPYGAVRRDPIDDNLYTPIKEAGVTLYEPHYPHLVPSEYKLYEEPEPEPEPGPDPEPEPEPSTAPDWDDLEDNHAFQVGDHFTYNGTEYEVLRVFTKQANWAPPALLNDYYKVADSE